MANQKDGSAVRVYPLCLGATKVPFGQLYGGLVGWRGLPALYRYTTDKKHFMIVPIHAYLIAHPQEGLILVDAGINWRQTHEHGQYYKGIAHYLFDDDEYQLDRSEELPVALARLGHRPEDVRRVVATHLHEDHVGGLAYLPESELVVSRDEWDNRGWKLFGFVPMVYQPSLQPAHHVAAIDYISGPFENFPASHDLTSDGTVKLLPTPGHTPGHLCVLVQLDGYQLLITGDCLYTLRHLANADVQAFGAGDWVPKQNASIQRIAELKRRLPDLVLVPGHDHTAYQFEHLVPGSPRDISRLPNVSPSATTRRPSSPRTAGYGPSRSRASSPARHPATSGRSAPGHRVGDNRRRSVPREAQRHPVQGGLGERASRLRWLLAKRSEQLLGPDARPGVRQQDEGEARVLADEQEPLGFEEDLAREVVERVSARLLPAAEEAAVAGCQAVEVALTPATTIIAVDRVAERLELARALRERDAPGQAGRRTHARRQRDADPDPGPAPARPGRAAARRQAHRRVRISTIQQAVADVAAGKAVKPVLTF